MKAIINELNNYLLNRGYKKVEISFSGFGSQGDGASFTGEVDVRKWVEVNGKSKYKRALNVIDPYLWIKRDRNVHYVHWNTTTLHADWGIKPWNHPNMCTLLEELREEIFKDHQKLNKYLYKKLLKIY